MQTDMAVAEGFEPYSATWSLSGKRLRAVKTHIWRYRQLPLESPRLWAKSGQRRVLAGPTAPPGSQVLRSPTATHPAGRSAGCRRSQGYDTLSWLPNKEGH